MMSKASKFVRNSRVSKSVTQGIIPIIFLFIHPFVALYFMLEYQSKNPGYCFMRSVWYVYVSFSLGYLIRTYSKATSPVDSDVAETIYVGLTSFVATLFIRGFAQSIELAREFIGYLTAGGIEQKFVV